MEEGPEEGLLNRTLGGEVREKHGKYRNKKSMGKGSTWEERVERCEGSMLEEGPGAGMLNKILGGEVQNKTESTENCRRKRKYGNVKRDTSKITIVVGREIGRRAKTHKNEGLLATRRP